MGNKWVNKTKFFLFLKAFYKSPIGNLYSKDILLAYAKVTTKNRGGSRADATSKMQCFVIIVNDFQPLAIITKHSILDVSADLVSPLKNIFLKGEDLDFEEYFMTFW